MVMTQVRDLHEQWMQDRRIAMPMRTWSLRFALARTLIEARTNAGLTQEQLAERMHTTQSVIARLEASCATFNPNARAFCQSHWYATENQL